MSIVAKLPYASQLRTGWYFLKAFGLGVEQARVLQYYLAGKLFPEYSDEVHLKATMEWLAHAQNICHGRGISSVYFLKDGWGVAYPETSGYILATYLVYADYSGDTSFVERAVQIGDWEIDIQATNGGVYSSQALRQTKVFNTGQVILGWCALFEHTREPKYLQAAIRAGNYLLNEQEADGAWRTDTYCGARTYHARVDWALLRLAQVSSEARYATAAVRNLRWVLAQQLENGWFDQCGFNEDRPNMHVIVYTLRGLWECWLTNNAMVHNLEFVSMVMKGADALCCALRAQQVANIRGMPPTTFDRNWRSVDNDSCLTGNAQLACFLYRVSHYAREQKYREAADIAVSAIKRTQSVESSILPLRGAIAGSYPIFHGYMRNAFPNWAAKFFADALLMKINYKQELTVRA